MVGGPRASGSDRHGNRVGLGRLANLSIVDEDFTPYHDGVPKRSSQVPPELREFIAWDGEGQNVRGENKPQAYVLFGCSTGDRILSESHIHTFDLLDFIVDIGKKHPTAFHVGFAFNYDANMILQSLSEQALTILHKTGRITLNRRGVGKYHIQFRPSKWFSVTKYSPAYDRKRNPHAKTTVKIFDLFGFFTKSFVKAYEELVGPIPSVVREGKDARKRFTTLTLDYIDTYWQAEIVLLRELADELRRRLYGAGLRITSWHGPGALASYAMAQHRIKDAMAECPPEVREAARYAYAGGRFEMFRLGRTLGPIYSVDINSAYPFAISRLPDLSCGEWHHVEKPRSYARFGVYRVRLVPQMGDSFMERAAGPLFHRDRVGNISFPWVVEGWYWSPEVMNLHRLDPRRYEVIEGWEYVGSRRAGTELPFAWIKDVYEKRREWKRQGIASQLALKLLMNSIYGKLAQRVGWNEEKRRAPAWHQLEWAGWVTAHCRAMLWDVISRIPRRDVLAVETDGLYTTFDPRSLGIVNSSELGGWTVEVYDEILYVQSGMAWLRKGDCEQPECSHQDEDGERVPGCAWTCKRRGLDARTFLLNDCMSYLQTLQPGKDWPAYSGTTTRFVGMGAALMSTAPFKVKHCVWQTEAREIRPGQGGKRVHLHTQCAACADGKTAWEGAHDMSIRSLAYHDPRSKQHDIPWEDGPEYAWRTLDIGEVNYD